MTAKQVREFGLLYSPYSRNKKWVDWFVQIAPVKAKRNVIVLKQYKKNAKRVLDYGCGIGFNTYYLAKSYPGTIGIDTDRESIEQGRKQLKRLQSRVKLIHFDGKKLPFKDNSFDIVVSNDVWEHADNPDKMLKEGARILKSDGIFLINTPNKLWPIETHYKLPLLSYLPMSIADWYVRLTQKGSHYHDIHLPTYTQFKKSIEKYFETQDITLDLLKKYHMYALDKERGPIVIWASNFLKGLEKIKKFPTGSFGYNLGTKLFTHVSVGWVFVCKKKNKRG